MRRRRGEGSVSKRKDGRFEVAIFVQTPLGRQRVRRYTETRLEADDLLVELRKKNRQGILTSSREKKFGEYMDYWLATKKNTVSPHTYTSYESTVRLYLKPSLGNKYLAKLNVADTQSFLDKQLELGKSVRNVQKMRIALSSILQKAASEELVIRNVARLTELPTYRPKVAAPWNFNQLGIFLEQSSTSKFYPIFLIMSLYGLRTSEALGLSWADIDVVNKVIRIRHQVQYRQGIYVYTEPKTQAGKRELPLTNIIASALSQVPRNDQGPLPDIIFKTSGNMPIDNNNLRRSFKHISKLAGLPIITLHYLRHTAATNLKDLGVAAKEAQSILGHAHISTTLQIYQHSNLDGKSKALEQYEQKLVDMSAYCRQLQPSNEKATV